ncbi:uncharacterized protein UTRI_10016 [Ustilago trichophora]|uniref:Uncharacterized protein n=1 Tax=Ustilago trichophora TaxID=86804 RepID=A0A5C3DRV9_9BASI|nr:uncharacterized protein UTRI_10016 [Ustilago trichophora]
MKIYAALIATSFTLFATSVAAGWLPDPNGSSHSAYCGGDGSLAGTTHVCFTTNNPNFASSVTSASDFQGYLTADEKEFVLIPTKGEATIVADGVTLIVTFDTKPAIEGLGENCSTVEFKQDGRLVKDAGGIVCQPGGKVIPWFGDVYGAPTGGGGVEGSGQPGPP